MIDVTVLGSVALVCWTAVHVCSLVIKHRERAMAPAPAPSVATDPMPSDIRFWVQSESEGWAREQARQAAEESFQRYGNWGRVREDLMIGATNG